MPAAGRGRRVAATWPLCRLPRRAARGGPPAGGRPRRAEPSHGGGGGVWESAWPRAGRPLPARKGGIPAGPAPGVRWRGPLSPGEPSWGARCPPGPARGRQSRERCPARPLPPALIDFPSVPLRSRIYLFHYYFFSKHTNSWARYGACGQKGTTAGPGLRHLCGERKGFSSFRAAERGPPARVTPSCGRHLNRAWAGDCDRVWFDICEIHRFFFFFRWHLVNELCR